jgi:hypothetical protein
MTYIKHDNVPKVICDLFKQIMEHTAFDEFVIDPQTTDFAGPIFKGTDHPWFQEKYQCLENNPLIYDMREKAWTKTINACTTDAEYDAVPYFDSTVDAPLELIKAVGKLNRIISWWLSDEDRFDDHYVNMVRVGAFNKAYPDCMLIPGEPLEDDGIWYSNDDNTQPVIRTPRGIICLYSTHELYNEIQLGNVDWSA